MEILLILFAFIAGIFGGMGMGGGTILIPFLTIFLGYTQTVSQGINLIAFFFLALASLFFHFKNKLIDTRYLLVIILCSAIFSLGGSFLANTINSYILKVFFGVFLILLACFEIYKFFSKKS